MPSRNRLSKGEVPDEDRKSCIDRCHMMSALSWWCMNDEAVEWRGAAMPGVHNCPFWGPAELWAPWWKFKWF